ncbi:MAG: hypothetical protein DMG23_01925, partial [Acidobacteria bacterium]
LAETEKGTKATGKQLKTVFVEGDSRAARLARDLLTRRTCFQLSTDETKADGVLTIDQQEGTWTDGSQNVGLLGFLRDKRGKVLWRARQYIQDDSSGQGTVMAVSALLKNLKTSACGRAK